MMSDEQQQQQQQQQQEQRQQQLQHQQQLQQHKLNKEPPSNAGSPTTPPRKINIHEMRNQDYVSRLLAATPPYLYSAPVGPNNFFFSDMLRSLVQARNNENARNLQLQQQSMLARRPRKRSWSQHRPFYETSRERKDVEEKQPIINGVGGQSVKCVAEKPLELTNKPFFQLTPKFSKTEQVKDVDAKLSNEASAKESNVDFEQNQTPVSGGGAVDAALQNTPPAASLPPQDLVLPPPPPVWYPPLYPPYGIDPLHFFIDLRVSGHIYDRKKENVSPLASADNNSSASTESDNSAAANSLLHKHRHGSAFTVPVPRSNEVAKAAAASDVINLSATKFENYAKYYDLGETKENHPNPKNSASYMLQHLPRLYSQFAARDLIAANSVESSSCAADNKSEPDCDTDSVDERGSADNCCESSKYHERDIDVEIIDSIKYGRTDGESSRCSSGDEASVTQID